MISDKYRTEFGEKVSSWCLEAKSFYNSHKEIKVENLSNLLAEIRRLDEGRQTLMQIIRDATTKTERDELRTVYDYRVKHSDWPSLIHSDIVAYLKREKVE